METHTVFCSVDDNSDCGPVSQPNDNTLIKYNADSNQGRWYNSGSLLTVVCLKDSALYG